MAALDTFIAFLDEIEATLNFVKSAASVRKKIGAVIDRTSMGGLEREIDAYLNSSPIEERIYQSFLVAAHAGFEQFVVSLHEDACALVNERRLSSTDLERSFPEVAKRFRRAAGVALSRIYEPKDYWKIDYEALVEAVGSTHKSSARVALSGNAFVVEGRVLDADALEKQLKNLGYSLSWDVIGRDAHVQSALGTSGTRETAKAARILLDNLCSRRNSLAHSQGSLSVTSGEIDSFVKYYRAVASVVGAEVLKVVGAKLK